MHHHEAYGMRASPEQQLGGLLKKGEVIAELGCGNGFYCTYLQQFASKLYCVDIDPVAIEEAKSVVKGENVIFLNEDSAHTSIPENSVDVILLANSFHDMRKEEVYKEIKRILKKDGRVIIIDWEKVFTPFGPPISIRMSAEDYISIFKDFKVEEKQNLGSYHYRLVLKRVS